MSDRELGPALFTGFLALLTGFMVGMVTGYYNGCTYEREQAIKAGVFRYGVDKGTGNVVPIYGPESTWVPLPPFQMKGEK